MTGQQLSSAQVADQLGISPDTWRSYVNRGLPKGNPAPAPDGHIGNVGWWWKDTIDDWNARRPGPGARTDLHKA